MPKARVHNEWFNTVSLSNRKSCPTCKSRLPPGESIWSWSEYRNAKKRLIKHFCRQCYLSEVGTPLAAHTDDCGCSVEIRTLHDTQPNWLYIPSKDISCKNAQSA